MTIYIEKNLFIFQRLLSSVFVISLTYLALIFMLYDDIYRIFFSVNIPTDLPLILTLNSIVLWGSASTLLQVLFAADEKYLIGEMAVLIGAIIQLVFLMVFDAVALNILIISVTIRYFTPFVILMVCKLSYYSWNREINLDKYVYRHNKDLAFMSLFSKADVLIDRSIISNAVAGHLSIFNLIQMILLNFCSVLSRGFTLIFFAEQSAGRNGGKSSLLALQKNVIVLGLIGLAIASSLALIVSQYLTALPMIGSRFVGYVELTQNIYWCLAPLLVLAPVSSLLVSWLHVNGKSWVIARWVVVSMILSAAIKLYLYHKSGLIGLSAAVSVHYMVDTMFFTCCIYFTRHQQRTSRPLNKWSNL